MKWESVADELQRIAVPGGWLYRSCAWVELQSGSGEPNRGYWHWSDPVFVAEAAKASTSSDLTDAEQAMLARGGVVDAIKSVRARLGIPLRDAKVLTDQWRNRSRP